MKFGDIQGEAIKSKVDTYGIKNGQQKVRLVGEVLCRYVYWIKGTNNKDIPMECLSFDREKEAFTNVEKDWVRTYYPDLKCGWAYSVQCIDPADPSKLKVFNLKKKMFQQIKGLAKKLGDPTDPVDGWDLVFTKTKTGPNAFNVEYTVDQLDCSDSKRALTSGELAMVEASPTIDEILIRPTPDAQKALIERIMGDNSGETVEDEESVVENFSDID